MNPIKELIPFQNALMQWYIQEARILPWRIHPTPYNVWISEIMLQQTRVDTVIPYFLKFIKELPTLEHLAQVEENQLMKLWQGLGYYRRALNLKKAAIEILERFNGQIPSTVQDLLSLPGIGPYTAGAITSIAFGKKAPAVDGNVLRILARISHSKENISDSVVRKKFETYAENIVPAKNPGDFNQALMDLGAQICIPNGQPKCMQCPISYACESYLNGNPSALPVKAPKKARKIEKKTVLIIEHEGRFALQKRGEGLLANLWEFPNVEGYLTKTQCSKLMESYGMLPSKLVKLEASTHIFTHLEWHMKAYRISLLDVSPPKNFTWATRDEIVMEYSIPSAFKSFIKLICD